MYIPPLTQASRLNALTNSNWDMPTLNMAPNAHYLTQWRCVTKRSRGSHEPHYRASSQPGVRYIQWSNSYLIIHLHLCCKFLFFSGLLATLLSPYSTTCSFHTQKLKCPPLLFKSPKRETKLMVSLEFHGLLKGRANYKPVLIHSNNLMVCFDYVLNMSESLWRWGERHRLKDLHKEL